MSQWDDYVLIIGFMQAFFMLYLVLMSLVMMNLVLGLAVSDISELEKVSKVIIKDNTMVDIIDGNLAHGARLRRKTCLC